MLLIFKYKDDDQLNFLKKIKPHLLTDDLIVLKFVMNALRDYPYVPADWSELLLKEAKKSAEKELEVLNNIDKLPINDAATQLLVEGYHAAPPKKKYLYKRILNNLQPEQIAQHRELIGDILANERYEEIEFLLNANKEELTKSYISILDAMENEQTFNNQWFTSAQHVAATLVKKGWVDEQTIEDNIREQLTKEFFDFHGILAVYTAGLMKMEKLLLKLVSLLNRDEDILLEILSDALIKLQSDDVVEKVGEMIRSYPEDIIFPASILGNTKTPLAVKMLLDFYEATPFEDNRSYLAEALILQLDESANPIIEEYFSILPPTFMFEQDKFVYAYFTVMGANHPNLAEWKQAIEASELARRKASQKRKDNPFYSRIEPIQVEMKIGRNDPCPCGSGKKYKKCCG